MAALDFLFDPWMMQQPGQQPPFGGLPTAMLPAPMFPPSAGAPAAPLPDASPPALPPPSWMEGAQLNPMTPPAPGPSLADRMSSISPDAWGNILKMIMPGGAGVAAGARAGANAGQPQWPAPPNPGAPPLTGAPVPNLDVSSPMPVPTIGTPTPEPAAAPAMSPAAPSAAPGASPPSWLQSAAQPRFQEETPHPGVGGAPKVETIGPGVNLPRALQEPQGNQLLGGLGDWIAANRNTLLMMGAGIAGGKNTGDAVSQGLMGAAQGKTADDAVVNKREMYKQLVSSGLTPQQALMAVTNPEAMKAMLPMMFPKYEQGKNENFPSSFDPARGDYKFGAPLPQLKDVKPGASISAVTPPLPAGAGGAGAAAQPGSVTPIVTGGPDPEQTMHIRKEIDSLPEVKTYQAAVPKYRSMVQSAKIDSAAADLEFLYGIAAVFDPNSVVREGEMKLVGAAQSMPEDLLGAMRSRVYGGARLSPATKERFLEVANNRMSELRASADTRIAPYTGIAQRFGLRNEDILPGLTDMPGRAGQGGYKILGVR